MVKTKKLVLILMLIFCVFLISNVSAVEAASEKYNVTVSYDKLKRGETTTFDVKVTNKNKTAVNPLVTFYLYDPDGDISVQSGPYRPTNGKMSFTKDWHKDQVLGNYTIKVDAFGLTDYQDTTYTKKIKLQEKTTMTTILSKTTINQGQSTTIKAKLRYGDSKNGGPLSGAILTLYYGGGMAKVMTNPKGEALFKYSSNKIGTQKLSVKFVGDDRLISSSKSFSLKVKALPDLILTGVKLYQKKYVLTIKNQGKAISNATKVKIKINKKYYKVAKIKSIKAGKTLKVVVPFYNYNFHRKYKKLIWINYNKATLESNYQNNKLILSKT